MSETRENLRALTFTQAVNEALRQEMERDERVFIMGEDVAGGAGRPDFEDAWGGPFRLTKGLIGEFGSERVRDTPISEAGFIGAGVGAAATGMRPIVDLMFVGFFGVCGDQIMNNAAKMHYMFGGKVQVPLTIMTSIGAGTTSAAQHSETLYSMFAHFPGLKCVCPSGPYSAKGLHIAAVRDDDPVIVFNHALLMGRGVNIERDDVYGMHVPQDPYVLPIGRSLVAREGVDVTLVGTGYTTLVCCEAADLLAEQGFSAEVVDLLSISPLDEETILRLGDEDPKGGDRGRGLPALQRRERSFRPSGGGGIRLPRRSAEARDGPPHPGAVQPTPGRALPPEPGEGGRRRSVRAFLSGDTWSIRNGDSGSDAEARHGDVGGHPHPLDPGERGSGPGGRGDRGDRDREDQLRARSDRGRHRASSGRGRRDPAGRRADGLPARGRRSGARAQSREAGAECRRARRGRRPCGRFETGPARCRADGESRTGPSCPRRRARGGSPPDWAWICRRSRQRAPRDGLPRTT